MPAATRFVAHIKDLADYTEELTWVGIQTFEDNVLIDDGGKLAIGHLIPTTLVHVKSSVAELRLEHTVNAESPVFSLRASNAAVGKIDLGMGAGEADNVFTVSGIKSTPNTYIRVMGTGSCWNAGVRFALSHLSPDDYGAVGADQDDNVYLTNAMAGGGLLFKTVGGTMLSIGSTGLATFIGDITQANAKYISTDQIRARDGDGLKLYDDGGNGIFVEDGGRVALGTITPGALFHAVDGNAEGTPTFTARHVGVFQRTGLTDAYASVAIIAGQTTGRSILEFGDKDTVDIGKVQYYHADNSLRLTANNIETLTIGSSGYVGVGIISSLAAKLHVDQSNTTAAIPVLILDQADIDQPIVKIIGTAESGSADRSLVAASDFTTPGAIVAWEMVYVQDDGNRFTDAKYYRPLYAIPTA